MFSRASMGIGAGALVGSVETCAGPNVSCAAFLMPVLLAASAMSGAI